MGVKTESGLKILALWLLAYPLVSALVSGIVAGPIAATEDVTFGTAFLFSFMGMTLCGIPLTSAETSCLLYTSPSPRD